jgi:hypothetical protein
MDLLPDLVEAFVSWEHATTVWGILAIAAVVIVFVLPTVRRFRRRAECRAFAGRHQLRHVGLLPSDKRSPYTQFDHVRRAVLLDHVVEGLWDGIEVASFDYPHRKGLWWTGLILTLPRSVPPLRVSAAAPGGPPRLEPEELPAGWQQVTAAQHPLAASRTITAEEAEAAVAALGPRASDLLAANAGLSFEANFSYMWVWAGRRLQVGELEGALRQACALAHAFAADAGHAGHDRTR